MTNETFDRIKGEMFVRDNGLYHPGAYFTDKTGRLHPDPDISDLVVDINRFPSVLTENSCQGHFYIQLKWAPISSKPIWLDWDREGNLIDCLERVSLKEAHPFFISASLEYSLKPEETELRYKPPNIFLYVRDDQQGARIRRLMESFKLGWTKPFYSHIFDSKMNCEYSSEGGRHFIMRLGLGSKQPDRYGVPRVAFSSDLLGVPANSPEALHLDAIRINMISNLHDVIKEELHEAGL